MARKTTMAATQCPRSSQESQAHGSDDVLPPLVACCALPPLVARTRDDNYTQDDEAKSIRGGAADELAGVFNWDPLLQRLVPADYDPQNPPIHAANVSGNVTNYNNPSTQNTAGDNDHASAPPEDEAVDDEAEDEAMAAAAEETEDEEDEEEEGGSNNYEEAYAEMDRDTAAILRERVADGSRNGYERRNITFMLWLFDNQGAYSHLIEPSILERMKTAHLNDKRSRTKAGRPTTGRKILRDTCRQVLRAISPELASSMPVKLELIDFNLFARYLSTFKKKVSKRTVQGDIVVSVADVVIRLGPSSFDGACSALAHLYQESGLDKEKVSPELWTKLTSYKKGTRRVSAKERKQHGLAANDGKKPLPFKAYRYLAKILFESDNAEHVAAHTFLLLEWNLISRAEYVVDSKIDLVFFAGDAMMFDMGKTKGDQEGTRNIDHPWHVYSNPIHPEICPVLGMARHLICNPTILNGQCDLFEGSSQYERFNKCFLDIIRSPEHRDQFVALGMPPEHFGTHSIRKGAATFISTGNTTSPPIASICVRANWAMPGVLSRYIKFENAGDQFVGKCVSGRPRNSTKFATSQAYFDFSSCSAEDKERNEKALHTWIKDRMPLLARDNEKVFCLFKNCIAALAHHSDFLDAHLHRNSMARQSVFMLETIPLAEFVTRKHPWDATDETPEVTGLPPDILLMAEIKGLKVMLSEWRTSMQSDFKTTLTDELDARQVGGAGYAQSTQIMDKLNELLEKTDKLEQRAEQNIDYVDFVSNDDGGVVDLEEDIIIQIEDFEVDEENCDYLHHLSYNK